MNKFKIKSVFESDDYLNNSTTKTFNAETLEEAFFHLTDFFRGIGYVFDGQIGIVKDKNDETQEFIERLNQMEFEFKTDNE